MKEVLILWVCLVCIWVLNPSSVDGSSDSSDVSSLNTLFSGLNSPGQLTGWTSNGGDPCGQSWKGITCSGSSVTTIKLSGLGLTGTFYDMQSMTSLVELDMSNNNLGNGGQIPYNLPPNLRSLNLAGNQFTEGIPYSLSLMNSLRYLNLSHNQLQDNLTDTYAQLSNLTTMDLSFNSIKGDLPLSFSNLSSLTTLYLQNNQFTGNITALASLPLNDLNVRNNHFTGWIPDQLKKINNLQIDGNSFNSSPAPPSPPLPPLPPSLPFTPPRRINPGHRSGGGNIPSNSSGNRKTSGIWVGVIAGIIISVLVIGAIIAFFLLRRKTQKSSIKLGEPFTPLASNEIQETKSMQTSSSFSAIVLPPDAPSSLKPPPIDRHKSFEEVDISNKPVVNKIKSASAKAVVYSVANLQVATDSFSADNLIGEGSIGRVYKAQFSNGKVLAVKNVNSNALPNNSSEDFIDVVSDISQLHHPNLTQLVGYCCEHRQHLLVYEFQKNGSLHDCLHLTDENNKQLTWSTRVKIALGSARALEYLHEVCSPSVIHKNFKSANILLDAELNPHLSDSGLSSFIPNPEYQGLDHNMGAPEVVMSGQYTLKSDVYSFGVVMLELLTGRKPFDSTRPRSEQSLVRWATPRLHDIDALDKMVDPNLQGLYPAKSLSRFADVIALCIQTEPEFRPPMSEVVQAVVRLVQRANISKRMIGGEGHDSACRADDPETHDYMF